MTLILWILVGVFWTVLVLIAGYKAGFDSGLEETESRTPIQLPNTYNFAQTLSLTDEDYQRIVAEVLEGVVVPVPADGKKGDQGPKGPGVNEALLKNGMTVQEWADATDDRLRRVGRKAGLDV